MPVRQRLLFDLAEKIDLVEHLDALDVVRSDLPEHLFDRLNLRLPFV